VDAMPVTRTPERASSKQQLLLSFNVRFDACPPLCFPFQKILHLIHLTLTFKMGSSVTEGTSF